MNHLHINVPDVAQAQKFFETYFEFQRVYPGSKRIFLKDKNDFLLALDPIGSDPQHNFPEWFHFGLCRQDPEWARSLYHRMKADGVKLADELEENEDAVVFFCWAPGPYKVEVRGNKAQ